jgi:sulfatase maturation enzyme AslB (radical SAM superfamily)
MEKRNVFRAWGRILTGRYPSLSIEVTRECPLRCPGCYAYEPEHLGDAGPLRSLADYKGQALVDGVLALVKQYRPLHISIVGGEPLVRYKELNTLLPLLFDKGIEVQVVTSAVREIPREWADFEGMHLVVSIDGLKEEHDVRRAPATYERILKNIENHRITVHCTVTGQMMNRPGYFEEFLSFWTPRPEVKKVWFSLFTPQIGATGEEILSPRDRAKVLAELSELRSRFPKLYLPDLVVKGYQRPPDSPENCIFARTTLSVTADLKTAVTPCQFGGNPDCSQCGCIASAGLKAVGEYKLLRILPLKSIYNASDAVGQTLRRVSN